MSTFFKLYFAWGERKVAISVPPRPTLRGKDVFDPFPRGPSFASRRAPRFRVLPNFLVPPEPNLDKMATVIPAPIRTLFSHFPLYTYPPVSSPYQARPIQTPTLWVHPPRSHSKTPKTEEKSDHTNVLSSDVECLKWQAYLALRFSQAPQPSSIAVRWDVSPSGAIDGRLPNLHVPLDTLPASLVGSSEGKEKKVKDDGEGDVLPAHHIPEWVAGRLGEDQGELEGYKDVEARDESRAWVALLEGNVHAALVRVMLEVERISMSLPCHAQIAHATSSTTLLEKISPDPSSASFISASGSFSFSLNPPPAPLTGLLSLLPSYGQRVDMEALDEKYRDAIKALSNRLSEDTWMLGSACVSYAHLFLLICAAHARAEIQPPWTRCSSRICTLFCTRLRRKTCCVLRSHGARILSHTKNAYAPS